MSTRSSSRQDGYSLAELLVVIAIVGLISLVTVPNFMSMMRASKFKGSLQQLTNDVRSTRQRAITRYTRTKIAFNTSSRAYGIYDFAGKDGSGNDLWTLVGSLRYMDQSTYFATPTSFVDRSDDNDSYKDVIFTNTGALETDELTAPYQVVIRTDDRIPKDQYTLDFKLAGGFIATGSTWH